MTFLEQILLTIVTAFATAILAYFGFWRQAKAELKKEYGAKFNEKKWGIYLRFLKLTKNRNKIFAEIVVDEMYHRSKAYYSSLDPIREIQDELVLISSKNVLSCYIRWKDNLLSGNMNARVDEDLFYQVLQAMREDLGAEKYRIDKQLFDRFQI